MNKHIATQLEFPFYHTTPVAKRYVSAPESFNQTTHINGVYLNPDEDVEWAFSYVGGNRIVTGYTITKRTITKCLKLEEK